VKVGTPVLDAVQLGDQDGATQCLGTSNCVSCAGAAHQLGAGAGAASQPRGRNVAGAGRRVLSDAGPASRSNGVLRDMGIDCDSVCTKNGFLSLVPPRCEVQAVRFLA